MRLTAAVADGARIKYLLRMVSGDRTRNNLRRGILAVKVDGHVGACVLPAVGHKPFEHQQRRARLEMRGRFAHRRVNPLDLHHFHLAVGAFLHFDLGGRIEDTLSRALAGAVVLFNIFHTRIFADMEAVNPVMLAFIAPGVVNTAAGNDEYVSIVADIEIVVDKVVDSGF